MPELNLEQLRERGFLFQMHITERCGQVNTPVSYSLGPVFKSRPGDRLS
jgi:hypothetical protein